MYVGRYHQLEQLWR